MWPQWFLYSRQSWITWMVLYSSGFPQEATELLASLFVHEPSRNVKVGPSKWRICGSGEKSQISLERQIVRISCQKWSSSRSRIRFWNASSSFCWAAFVSDSKETKQTNSNKFDRFGKPFSWVHLARLTFLCPFQLFAIIGEVPYFTTDFLLWQQWYSGRRNSAPKITISMPWQLQCPHQALCTCQVRRSYQGLRVHCVSYMQVVWGSQSIQMNVDDVDVWMPVVSCSFKGRLAHWLQFSLLLQLGIIGNANEESLSCLEVYQWN